MTNIDDLIYTSCLEVGGSNTGGSALTCGHKSNIFSFFLLFFFKKGKKMLEQGHLFWIKKCEILRRFTTTEADLRFPHILHLHVENTKDQRSE